MTATTMIGRNLAHVDRVPDELRGMVVDEDVLPRYAELDTAAIGNIEMCEACGEPKSRWNNQVIEVYACRCDRIRQARNGKSK